MNGSLPLLCKDSMYLAGTSLSTSWRWFVQNQPCCCCMEGPICCYAAGRCCMISHVLHNRVLYTASCWHGASTHIHQRTSIDVKALAAGAASVRVSNELGAGRPAAARLAAQSVAVLALTLMAAIAVLLASLHRVLPLVITSDPAVLDGTQRVIPIVAYMMIGDGMNACMSGVVRGCGQQAKGRLTQLQHVVLRAHQQPLLANSEHHLATTAPLCSAYCRHTVVYM